MAEDTGRTHLLLREVREAGDPFGRSDRSDVAPRNDDHGENPRIQEKEEGDNDHAEEHAADDFN